MKKKWRGVPGAGRILLMNTAKQSLKLNPPSLRGSLAGMRYPAIAELKYDGEFDFLYYTKHGPTYTINKNGTVKTDFPALAAIHQVLMDKDVEDAVLLCELFWNTGKAGELYKLNSNKKSNNVNLIIFDIHTYNSMNISSCPLITRKEVLLELFHQSWQAKYKVVENDTEAKIFFKDATKLNWEGIVVKSLDNCLSLGPCSWVKMKYKDRNDYPVTLVDLTKERIEVGVPFPGNTHAVMVGVKAPNKYKKHISVGDTVTIEHQGVLPSGSLRHPVLIPKPAWK